MRPTQSDADVLLTAYLDGELDALAAVDFERRMEAEPALRAQCETLEALRHAVRQAAPRDAASEGLRARIAAIAVPPVVAASAASRHRFHWQQLAASMALGAVVAAGGTVLALRSDGGGVDVAALVAEHRQTLLAASPVDVESSDKHTVKPWFDRKLALSPAVVDLATDGFALAGGRVDVVGGKLVPAMIYRRREHLISLIAVPRGSDGGGLVARPGATLNGYGALFWRGPDFDYFAVSDVAPEDLAAFAAAWHNAAG